MYNVHSIQQLGNTFPSPALRAFHPEPTDHNATPQNSTRQIPNPSKLRPSNFTNQRKTQSHEFCKI